MKTLFLKVLTSFAALLVLGVVGEVVMRTYYTIRQANQPGFVPWFEWDDTLGWRSPPHLDVTTTATDAASRTYPLRVTTNALGFRQFGDTAQTGRLRLLVLGDSYTQAVAASDGKAYYAHLGDSLDAEIFAYGCGGYGTVQEFLVLDRYVDRIRPHAVLLQLCPNDFFNNDYALEWQSTINNNAMLRPYLDGRGHIRLRLPKRLAGLRDFANRHSRLLYFVFLRLDRVLARYAPGTVEERIGAGKSGQALLRPSAAVLNRMLRRMRARVPAGTAFYAFSTRDTEPYFTRFKEATRQNGFVLVGGIGDTLQAAERRGVVVKAADCVHWNETGHRLAAGVLTAHLRRASFQPRKHRTPTDGFPASEP